MPKSGSDFSFPIEDVKFGKPKKLPIQAPDIRESSATTPEQIDKGIEISTQARVSVSSIFDTFGKPLSESIDGAKGKSFPISIEGGKVTNTYQPQGKVAKTGGMYPNFGYGDGRVQGAQSSLQSTQSMLNNSVSKLTDIQSQFINANAYYNQRITENNNFVDTNIATFQGGWDLLNAGIAEYVLRPDNVWVIQRTASSGNTVIPDIDKKISDFNRIQPAYIAFNNAVSVAWDQVGRIDAQRTLRLGDIDFLRSRLSGAEQDLFDAQKGRYRYMMSGVNFSDKITESQKVWKTLYGKEYTNGEVGNQYYSAMDSLGMLMTKIQAGSVLTEADYKKEITAIGKSLSDQEKIIFLGMVGANLDKLTYNWDIAKSGKLTAVKPFESIQALAKAFQTGKQVPAGVCSSIHVAVASIAESWGTPAGTLTVSNGGTGHVIAIMDIGGKKVISDYGKIYTAENMENLIDVYALANKGIAIRNYITDASGNIIGHVDTRITKAFRREVLSETSVNDFIRNGKTPEDGVKIILFTDRKGLKGQYTFQNGIYVGGKYSEATLVTGLSSKTIQAEVGKKWSDIDLGGGWNGTAFVEGSLSQTGLRYGSEKIDQKSNILQMQAGLRGEKTIATGSNIYAGIGTNIIGQASKPTVGEYKILGPLGTGVSAESGLSMVAGANIQASPHTKFSGEVGIDTQKGPNVQSLSAKDLNPLGKGYHTTSVRLGAETSMGSGSGFGKLELKKGPLTEERTIGAGYRTDSLSATVEQTKIQPTHIFGASADSLVRANIEKNFGKGVTGFFGVEKGNIAGTKTQIGAKLEF